MQCYEYFAAITAVANTIDTLPGTEHRLPYSVIADWMEENGIEPEDLLQQSGESVRAIVAQLIEQDQPRIPHAA